MIECLGSGRIADVWLADYGADPIFKVDAKHVAVKLPRGNHDTSINYNTMQKNCKTIEAIKMIY